ncbi:MAG: phage terminase large subunit [Clostridia bacterium]|nr:phage terminase large subunit [Clostridia bacterium]
MAYRRVILEGYPQEKQRQFFESRAKYTAYGGARGGGKSWALRRKLVLMCLNYEGLSVLLLRRTFPELRENHIRPLLSELCDIAVYTDTRKCFEFPNGSRIKLGYCDCEEDVNQYQGQEYDVIGFDEATHFTEYQFQTLKACLRGANDFPKRIYLTCNPGGVGHGWVKRLFIDRSYRKGERSEDYAFISASVYDNGILLRKDPDYLDQLESLPQDLRNAWLYGDWNVFSGQYFPEFSKDIHVVPPFEIPASWKRYCSIDYGLDMLAVMLVAMSPSGDAYVYDEIHESGLIVSEAAERIRKKADGVSVFIAPSDLWSRQKDSGKSIAELFADNGVYLTRISTERVEGWLCLKEWLCPRVDESGGTSVRMRFFPACENIIRCLPLLLYDRNRSGDVSTEPHAITHAPDALRYFAVSRPAVSKSERETSEGGRLIERLGRHKGRLRS